MRDTCLKPMVVLATIKITLKKPIGWSTRITKTENSHKMHIFYQKWVIFTNKMEPEVFSITIMLLFCSLQEQTINWDTDIQIEQTPSYIKPNKYTLSLTDLLNLMFRGFKWKESNLWLNYQTVNLKMLAISLIRIW